MRCDECSDDIDDCECYIRHLHLTKHVMNVWSVHSIVRNLLHVTCIGVMKFEDNCHASM